MMKNKMILFILFILLIPIGVSMKWDNIIKYEGKDKIIIEDNFGLGGKLVTVEKIYNTDICLTECYTVWNVTIHDSEDDFLDLIEFKDIHNDKRNLNYKFEYASAYKPVETDEYETVCYANVTGNQTETCYQKKTGSRVIGYSEVWDKFNVKRKLPAGNYIIKLTGYKNWEEDIDWIPTFYGKKADKWDWWLGEEPIGYWKMNEITAGSNAVDSSPYGHDGVNNGNIAFVSGKLNNAADADYGDTDYFVVGNHALYDLNGSFTIAAWINMTNAQIADYNTVISKYKTGGVGYWRIFNFITDKLWGFQGGDRTSADSCWCKAVGVHLNDTLWHRIVVTRDGTSSTDSMKIYVDNILKGQINCSASFNFTGDDGAELWLGHQESLTGKGGGLYDDIQLWNMTWSASDVAADWNAGAGEEFASKVELISPTDNVEINVTSGYSINFVGDFNSSAGYSLFNTTLYIWNETGTIVATNFADINGGITNRTNLTVSNLDFGTYLWNYEACINDSSTFICKSASPNRTFDTTFQYKVNYTEDSFVLLTETFSINVSYNNLVHPTITGTFEYNNTIYTASKKSDNGGYAYFENSLTVPNVAANISFMWNFTISNTTNSIKKNTITYNQTIVTYLIDDCTTYGLLILNYSLKDEDTQTQLVAATENTTIEVDVDIYQVGKRIPVIEFSQNYTKINPAQVCLDYQTLDNNNYEMDVIVRYTATNYVSEYHNIQNFTLTNSSIPQNINLFDLLISRATSFLITYKDSTFLPVENALLDISRRYIEEGVFKSVEIPKTDAKGQAVAHLVVSETIYTITIKKDGRTLATFENVMAICDDVLAEDCKINLNAFSTGIKTEDWDTYQNLDYTLNWDEDTREIKLIFTVLDGSSETIDLNATRFDRFGNLTVCSDTITSSSGTISCIVPQSYGNITIIAEVYKSGELIASAIYKIFPPPEETFGGTVYILLLIMMITLPLMFITSAVGVVIGAILGLIMAALLNVFAAGTWIGIGSTIVWLIIAGGILIWKISQRARG